ncbi:MAG TPA: hypothetical protein DIT13_07500, partial [Verrucomicrobiales bacterium]|nr:hypothetical protein [Verrucomicrobiales bacterium]
GGIRVPCLMSWPARLPKGSVCETPAITMDLHATFLLAAGLPLPEDKPLDGMDLLPHALSAEAAAQDRSLCW